jgi:hypothetical protein
MRAGAPKPVLGRSDGGAYVKKFTWQPPSEEMTVWSQMHPPAAYLEQTAG